MLYWLSKARLVVFNMVLLDFGFYATHAAMHFNYFPSSQIAMLCLTLIVLDILEMVDMCRSNRSWNLFLKLNDKHKSKDQGSIEKSKEESDILELNRTSHPQQLPKKRIIRALSHINPADSSQGYSSGD